MTQWYFQDADSTRVGPLSDEEFHERLAGGAVVEKTRVWRSGLTDWTTYGALRAYDEQRQNPQPAPPPPSEGSTPTSSESNAPVEFSKCAGCAEQWPAHLLKEVEKRQLCGRCILDEEKRAWRRTLSKAKGPGNSWIWKHLAICALLAIIVMVVRLAIGSTIREGRKAMREVSKSEHRKNLRFAPRDSKP